jgi:hypothetical protein
LDQAGVRAADVGSPRVRVVGFVLLGIAILGFFGRKTWLPAIPLLSVSIALTGLGRASFRIVYTAAIVSIMLFVLCAVFVLPFVFNE